MSNELLEIVEQLEKEAASFGSIAKGIQGFFSGQRAANAGHVASNTARELLSNPHATDEAKQLAQQALSHAGQTQAPGPSLFNRVRQEFQAGKAQAGKAFHENEAARQTEALKSYLPQQAPAAPVAQAAAAPAAQAAVQQAPQQPSFLQRHAPAALAGAGITAAGYAGYRGLQNAAEQDTRAQDYMNNMRHNLNSPMPSMTVTASYDQFAKEKTGARQPEYMIGTVNSAVAKSLADTLGNKLVADPIDAFHAAIKKRFYDEPKWQQNFDNVVQNDPTLAKVHAESPNMLPQVFDSVKRFSPTIAKDHLATRNLLRHAVMSGGELDHSVMKMLAETEKFHNEGKRR